MPFPSDNNDDKSVISFGLKVIFTFSGNPNNFANLFITLLYIKQKWAYYCPLALSWFNNLSNNLIHSGLTLR